MITAQCIQELHGFCREPDTCQCENCHFGPCVECGRTNLQKTYEEGMLCAGCYRIKCRAKPASIATCDTCGTHGAFRNPGTRRNEFLCLKCHAAAGDGLSLVPGAAPVVSSCTGRDATDPLHDWMHVKGTRFACTGCRTSIFNAEMRQRMRREELSGRA